MPKPSTSLIELSDLLDHEVMREVAHALTLARLVEGLTALPADHAPSATGVEVEQEQGE